MEHAPRMHNVEHAKAANVIAVEDRALSNGPAPVIRKIAFSQGARARHRSRIVIEGRDHRAESACSEAGQATSGANVQKCLAIEPSLPEQFSYRLLRKPDAGVVDCLEKLRPVLAELEAKLRRRPHRACGG